MFLNFLGRPALFSGFPFLVLSLLSTFSSSQESPAWNTLSPGAPPLIAASDAVVETLVGPQSTDPYPAISPYSGVTKPSSGPIDEIAVPGDSFDSGNLMLRVQQLEIDVRRLNGFLEDTIRALKVLEEKSLERYVDIDRRLSEGGQLSSESGNNPVILNVSSDKNPPVAAGRARYSDSDDGEEASYKAAYQLVRKREFELATSAFITFLDEYPFGNYAPNAHYWLGELYLVLNPPEPELARQSFQLLLDQYPADLKVPDAMYKLGRVHFMKGNRQRSKDYLSRVISEYPSHAATQLARQFLLENF